VFLTTNVLATAGAPGNWVMCINESGEVSYPVPQKLIHGGLIQAGTITAAYGQIGTAAIQTANINDLAVQTAKIDNLAVGTIKIADDATRYYNTASISGFSDYFTAPPGIPLVSVSVTSGGGLIEISGSVVVHNYSGASNAVIAIYRDSTDNLVGAPQIVDVPTGDAGETYIFISAIDFPGSGSYTYYLYGGWELSGFLKGKNRNILCNESKGK
jgi:hypothetical protein